MSLLREIVRGTTASGVFAPRLDRYLLARVDRERRGGYHPSEISRGYCPRELALLRVTRKSKKSKVNARMSRVFDNGHGVHDRMQRYAREMGLVLNHPLLNNKHELCEESKLDHPVGLTGNTDNILVVGSTWYVTDYKSINSDSFKALLVPLDSHKRQVWLYTGMVEYMVNPDHPLEGLIVYENKNDQELKEFVVPWGREGRDYFKNVIDDLYSVNEAVERKDPSVVPCTCGRCPTLEEVSYL